MPLILGSKDKKEYLKYLRNDVKDFTVNFKKRYDLFPWNKINKINKSFHSTVVIVDNKKYTVLSLIKEIKSRQNILKGKLSPSTYNYILSGFIKDIKNVNGDNIKKVYENYSDMLDNDFKTSNMDLQFCLSGLKEINKVLKNTTVSESTEIVEESSDEDSGRSNLDKNYKPKGEMKLSELKMKKVNTSFINKYKKKYSVLKHIDESDNINAWFHNDEFVAVAAVDVDHKPKHSEPEGYNWITVLWVHPSYRGYKLGKQILDYAVKTMKGNALTVRANNEIAFNMYKHYGFKTTKENINDVKSGKSPIYRMYLNLSEVKESTDDKICSKNKKLYHGSSIQGLSEIKPDNKSRDPRINRKVVYTSPNKSFAACYGSVWNDDIASQGSWDNYKTTVFGLTNEVETGKPCSLYEIENDGTGIVLNDREVIFDHPIKVKKEIKYKSFKDMLKSNGVKTTSREEYKSFVGTNKVPKFNNYFKESVNDIPEDIKEFNKELNSWDYGILINNKIYKDNDLDFSKYKTIPVDKVEKYKVGVCWDFVNYEAKWFKEKGYNFETYYIQIDDEHDCPSHTFLLFKYNNKIYYFESSWFKYQGIEEFPNINEALKTIINRHIENYGDESKKYGETKFDFPVFCFKYNTDGLDKNLDAESYMNKIYKMGKEIKVSGIKSPNSKMNTTIESEESIMNEREYSQIMLSIFEYEMDFENDELVEEATNMDFIKELKTLKKRVKEIRKSYKKNFKAKDFKAAIKNAQELKSICEKTKKNVDSMDSNMFSTACSMIIGYIKYLGESLLITFGIMAVGTSATVGIGAATAAIGASNITPAVAAGTSAVVSASVLAAITKTINAIRMAINTISPIGKKVSSGKFKDESDLNLFKNDVLRACDTYIKSADKLVTVAKEAEAKCKEQAKSDKKDKEVKEAADTIIATKLAIYEACADGQITIEEREELLADLAVESNLSNSIAESNDEDLSTKEIFESVVKKLYEKCNDGIITVEERELLISKAHDKYFPVEESEETPEVTEDADANPSPDMEETVDMNNTGIKDLQNKKADFDKSIKDATGQMDKAMHM